MEQLIFRLESEAKQQLQKSLERAKYYQDKSDHSQALDNYLDALASLAEYTTYFEGAAKLRNVNAGGTGNVGFLSGSAVLLFDLFYILADIYTMCIYCEGMDEIHTIYVAEKVCLVVGELAKYQKEFDVKQIQSYDDARSMSELVSGAVRRGQETLADIKKVKPEKTKDGRLQKIRIALKKISSTESCPIQLEKSDGCFIATAAYMTLSHPDLDTFRSFRDQKLLSHPLGKFFVSVYYQVSPGIASYIAAKPKLRQFVKQQLTLIAQWLREQ